MKLSIYESDSTSNFTNNKTVKIIVDFMNKNGYSFDGTTESIDSFVYKITNGEGVDYQTVYRFYKSLTVGKADPDNLFETTCAIWTQVKRKPRGEPDFTSFIKSGISSQYWYKEDGVYRKSNHWGASVSTCDWFLYSLNDLNNTTLKRDRCIVTKTPITGFCKWSNFALKCFINTTEPSFNSYDNYIDLDDISITNNVFK